MSVLSEDAVRTPDDGQEKSFKTLLTELSACKTHPEKPVPEELVAVLKKKFQNSALGHNCYAKEWFDLKNRKPCSKTAYYDLRDFSQALQLAADLHIEAVTPEIAEHLTAPNMGATMAGLSSTPLDQTDAINALLRFGEGAVPLVLKKLQDELQYDDAGTTQYWYFAQFYFKELYGDTVIPRVR